MTGPGILNGGVFWFDFVFSKGLKKNKFSSDPQCDNENYYHGLFYFKNPIKVKGGEVMNGKIALMTDPDKKEKVHIKGSFTIKE